MTTRPYGENRHAQIRVRVSENEHQLIARRARDASMSFSDYVRARVLAEPSPDALRAAHTITSHLAGLESAIVQARKALEGNP